ncbi:L-aspartate oxidase [Caballeronia catudaia]|uniref:L-aspartate oxidase n=1 Tax=Caballeronia catudaia TaxID=1777136 RepID=A0A158C6E1_9BURK|nr:FAD-binding protein [Caballeronia catudaia]SAK77889.1 L-aspartate oxidase [Caballeronia catudaia]
MNQLEEPQTRSTDVLVVGGGGAALRAALEAEANGASVLVTIKGEFRKSGATFHSVAEVGAFNVPDNAGRNGDSPEIFINDILRAAQGMADPALARILANEAEDAMKYLENFGVKFEKDANSYLVFKACFSSVPRSHVIPEHFKPIVKALGQEATRRRIQVLDRTIIVDLIVRDGQCVGVLALDSEGRPLVIEAKSTILTTGGASQIFAKNLYPSDITGDGYAMAFRAGARLANLEFMQAGVSTLKPFINLFGNYLWDAHPRLTDRNGKPFLRDYLPDGLSEGEVIGEKAKHFPFSASDVSRYVEIAIQTAINEGRGTEEGGVFMDFAETNFDAILANKESSITKMWPMTYQWYKERNVDLFKDKFQVTCSAHAVNGGILIDADGKSSLKGLFAAGEVAAGPHGADRLGGNMAVTCQVFGRRAGAAAAVQSQRVTSSRLNDLTGEVQKLQERLARQGLMSESIPSLHAELQAAANRHLLIVRTGDGLQSLIDTCTSLSERLRHAALESPADQVAAIELENMLLVTHLMARAALERRESRGGHFRQDFPTRDSSFDTSIILDKQAESQLLHMTLQEASARS